MITIAQAKEAADIIRVKDPETAAKIDAMVGASEAAGHSAPLDINISIKRRLEKFDGEFEEGKEPVEVIEDEFTI